MNLRVLSGHGVQLNESVYGDGESMPAHAHSETCITLVLGGEIRERVGSRTSTAGPAWVGIKPADLGHADRFVGGVRTMKLRLGHAFLEGVGGAPASLRQWAWVPAGAAAPVLTRMLQRLRRDRSPDASWIEDCALDLLGALEEDGRLGHRSSPPRWLVGLRDELELRADGGVRTSALARERGLHPVYLARLFRRHFGESISDCVRRARVRRAATLLADTDEPISGIAYGTGFADQSHLTRTFRSETGMPPGAWRRAARLGSFKTHARGLPNIRSSDRS